VRSTENIRRLIRNLNLDVRTNPEADRRVLQDLLQAKEKSQETVSASASPKIRRLKMFARVRSWKVAAVIAVVLGAGAISVVGVNIGRIYYWGKSADGTHHIFYSKGPSGDGFTMMDANGVTDVEQARRDLEEMEILSQQGKKELLRVEETMMNGTVEMRTHEYRYELSDGRTSDMREGVKWGGGFDNKERWQEWRQLKEAGPGKDLGTYEETVDDRVFSFKRERYVLGDGTEIIWSVGTPKDGQ
jgi:hypothetical protein